MNPILSKTISDITFPFRRFMDSKQDRLKILLLLCSYILTFSLIFMSSRFDIRPVSNLFSDFEVGKVADRDLFIEQDIVYIDQEATHLKRDAAAALVPPVYIRNSTTAEKTIEDFNALIDLIGELSLQNEMSNETGYLELQSRFPNKLSYRNFEYILSYDDPLVILSDYILLAQKLINNGILTLPEKFSALGPTDKVEVWYWEDNEQRQALAELDDLISKGPGLTSVLIGKAEGAGLGATESMIFADLFSQFADENLLFDSSETERKIQKAKDDIDIVVKKLTQGEILVRKGVVITRENFEKIRTIAKYSSRINTKKVIGTLFLLFIFYILIFSLLRPPIIEQPISNEKVYLLLVLLATFEIVIFLVLQIQRVPDWLPIAAILPTSLLVMIACIFVSHRVGIIFSLALSLLVLFFIEMNPFSFIFCLVSGIAAAFVVQGAEKRIDLLNAGIYQAIINAGILASIGFLNSFNFSWFLVGIALTAANGFFCSILNIGFLPLLEHIINVPTVFRLMELSDLNSPILKRMLTLAPGTYSHSVNVSNLAETACKNINANALLARVGAYYHDIGKIDQSEYFIENQRELNKHDDLKPSLSTAIIKSHVKIGIEKAKELGLPKEIIEIIAQHHGNSLIKYFYQRAVEQDVKKGVSPEDFSYSGSPPGSKEAAVVMLADGVEAVTRTLKKPTVSKIEKSVWTIFMDRFNAGQLDSTTLTFRELEIIKDSFVQVLSGTFHSRIEYPGQEKEDN
jgi:cyclic-di-AMP phosphodiesterase PgpH